MIQLFIIFLLLFGSVGLGVLIHQDPGYLFISFHDWILESTLSATCIFLLVVFFIIHMILLSLQGVRSCSAHWRYWTIKRAAQKALKKKEANNQASFEKALELNTSPEGYFALGQLFDDLNQQNLACAAYREGLKRALKL